jgi:hypothetical protein
MTAKITGVSNKPNASGDHVIELSLPEGSTTTALISPDMARVMMDALQPYILERAAHAAQYVVCLCSGDELEHGSQRGQYFRTDGVHRRNRKPGLGDGGRVGAGSPTVD